MGLQWDKQPASRFIKYQNLSWTGSGVAVSTGLQKMASTPATTKRTAATTQNLIGMAQPSP